MPSGNNGKTALLCMSRPRPFTKGVTYVPATRDILRHGPTGPDSGLSLVSFSTLSKKLMFQMILMVKYYFRTLLFSEIQGISSCISTKVIRLYYCVMTVVHVKALA
ncbi:hypothetical protein TNCV_3744391 [Trichonephila clavipes]|nr:hypothetical protein TNCV_3744391 [Trichonephila clavipes]